MKTLTFSTFLLVAIHSLCATQLLVEQNLESRETLTYKRNLVVAYYARTYNFHTTPREIGKLILYHLYGDYFQYRNKPLPKDLSNMDLRFFDFTGCTFQSDLTNSRLEGTILDDTNYEYETELHNNAKKELSLRPCKEELASDLKSIARVYPTLKNSQHKANLLLIGSGLSHVFLYSYDDEAIEFFVQLQYWVSCLLKAQKQLPLHKLQCSHKEMFESVVEKCWPTRYNKEKVDKYKKKKHTNLESYYNDFNEGVLLYCFSNTDDDISRNSMNATNNTIVNYYSKAIQDSLLGLQRVSKQIKSSQIQEEIYSITHALAESYKIQKWDFLHCYLECQVRLISLKKLLPKDLQPDILIRDVYSDSMPDLVTDHESSEDMLSSSDQ